MDYLIPQVTREKLELPSYILTVPLKGLAQIENHINAIPSQLISQKQAVHVYNDIKTAFSDGCDLKQASFALPANVLAFYDKVKSEFVLDKTKKFIRLYEAEASTLQLQMAAEGSSRKRSYEEVDSSEAASTSTVIVSTSVPSSLLMEKHNKQFTIPNPSACLASHHKPKMQRSDLMKLSDVCSIAMELTVEQSTFVDDIDVQQYLLFREQQEQHHSLQQFYGMEDYAKELLSTSIEALPGVAWTHAIHQESDALTKQFARVIALTLSDFTSNCRQPPDQNCKHERTAFVKYVVSSFKYLPESRNRIYCHVLVRKGCLHPVVHKSGLMRAIRVFPWGPPFIRQNH